MTEYTIGPTPRNKLLGLLADATQGVGDFMEHKNGLAPVGLLSQLLGVKPIARTLDNLSYGRSLGTGKGMTWKPTADTADAFMTLAPLAKAAPGLLNSGAAAIGSRLEAPVAAMVNKTLNKGGLPAQLLQDMAQGTQSPLTVWHGSPHKFNKFNASKIGTGEGAQAYGHGLYFAENPTVAGQYKDMLSSSEYRLKGGGEYNPSDVNHIAGAVLDEYGGSAEKAIKGLSEKIAQNKLIRGGEQWNKDLLQQLNAIKSGKAAQLETVSDGSLYKVDLPDEHIAKMLDWDKPLSQQPKNVKDAYKKYINSPQASEHAKSWTRYSEGMRLDQAEPLLKNPGGENLYKNAFPSREAANAWAIENGIPGIRYLDGGSRGVGTGSSNFVVFPGNEDILKIMERNGKGLLE